jgi:hypothetical protein
MTEYRGGPSTKSTIKGELSRLPSQVYRYLPYLGSCSAAVTRGIYVVLAARSCCGSGVLATSVLAPGVHDAGTEYGNAGLGGNGLSSAGAEDASFSAVGVVQGCVCEGGGKSTDRGPRRHTNHIMVTRIAKDAIAPTTIPAIAPPESPPELADAVLVGAVVL